MWVTEGKVMLENVFMSFCFHGCQKWRRQGEEVHLGSQLQATVCSGGDSVTTGRGGGSGFSYPSRSGRRELGLTAEIDTAHRALPPPL